MRAFVPVLVWVVGFMPIVPPPGQSNFAPKPRRPWVLEGHNVVALSPPPVVRAAAGPYVDDSFRGVAADLNRDGTDDYILQGRRDECGTAGCTYWIFDGATARLIGDLGGDPIVVRAESTRGFPNIEAYSHGSAESGVYISYAFNGSEYVQRSKKFLEGSAMWTLIRAWRRYPRWPPTQPYYRQRVFSALVWQTGYGLRGLESWSSGAGPR